MNRFIVAKPLFDFLIMIVIFTLLLWLILDYFGLISSSVFYAWAIVTLNTVIGYVLFEYGYALKRETFFRTALLGQAVRLLIAVVLIASLMLTHSVETMEFAGFVIGFYVCYLPIEVLACFNKMRFEKKLDKLLQL